MGATDGFAVGAVGDFVGKGVGCREGAKLGTIVGTRMMTMKRERSLDQKGSFWVMCINPPASLGRTRALGKT